MFKNFKQKLSKKNNQVGDSSSKNHGTLEKLRQVKNFQGEQMVFSASEEQNLYFQMLEKEWYKWRVFLVL